MFDKADSPRPVASRNAALVLALVGALALPGAAQAQTTASVSAVAKASVRGEAHLVSAQRLADQTGSLAQARARALVARGSAEIHTAMSRTQALMASADSTKQVKAAARAGMRMSSTLSRAARLRSEIAIEASGRLERQAAAGLVDDVRMQQAVLVGSLSTAVENAAPSAQAALKGARHAARALGVEVQAAARTAASSQVTAAGKASGELAVGIATQALRANAKTVSQMQAGIDSSTQDAVQRLREDLAHTAAGVAATIQATSIDTEQVTVPGPGLITLGSLAQLGIQATASTSVTADAHSPAGQAQASGQASGTLGLLGR